MSSSEDPPHNHQLTKISSSPQTQQSQYTYLKDGKYAIDHSVPILGKGSFGTVYRCYSYELKQWVALKQIDLKLLQNYGDEMKQIILNEINIMKKFTKQMNTHPCSYLVKQYDCFRTDTSIYIVMELCLEGTLYQSLTDQKGVISDSQKNYSEVKVVQILKQLIQGLVYLQNMQIAHRDFKPENIFLTSTKEGQMLYKIGDFGFSAQKATFDDVMGTYPYMAPQIFKMEQYSNKVDVWSLGATLHQLLFGELFFSGKNKWEVQKEVKEKEYKLMKTMRTKISQEMFNFISSCLIKDKNLRPSASELLNHPIFKKESHYFNQGLSSGDTNPSELTISEILEKQSSEERISPNSIFSMLEAEIDRCKQIREFVCQFQEIEQQSKCKHQTQFVQMYLLKHAFCVMNRINTSLRKRQNHMNLQKDLFEQLIDEKNESNQEMYAQLKQKSENEYTMILMLWVTKYRYFSEEYCGSRFSAEQKNLIFKVIDNNPTHEPNSQVVKKQLQKWVSIMWEFHTDEEDERLWENTKQLRDFCEDIVNSIQ